MNMPNFLIIGAAKSGTTSLYNYLKQHPQIYVSPIKETHFFSFEGQTVNFRGPGDVEHINRNTITDLDTYRSQFKEVKHERAIGEASPYYLYFPVTPHRIYHYLPGVKLIAVIRNPVDRAYSSFCHLLRDGRELITDFAKALKAEESHIQAHWGPIWYYTTLGFYYEQLKRYFNLFESHQIKVYLYDEFRQGPAGIVQDIFQFLEVSTSFRPDFTVQYNVSGIPKNKTLHNFIIKPNPLKTLTKSLLPRNFWIRVAMTLKNQNLVKPKLSSEVHARLLDLYREDILKTQALIQQDLSYWLRPVEDRQNISV